MPGGQATASTTLGRGGRDSLPVRRHWSRIVNKVRENRVTLIYATTGSGKSSQVPQMLSEEGLGPILCTQPRRLAVVAVAKRVAEERGTALGEDVGYQIGQLNLSTSRSKIVFKTAGVLLEEFRANGTEAISKYKVVILDEVHERSVESDLVLTCLKQLLRTTGVKLVLMSATADLLRYEEYFKEFHRDEGVEKIAIQNIAEQLQGAILSTKVVYLEQVVKLLGDTPQHTMVLNDINQPSGLENNEVEIKETFHVLVKDLIVHLHHSEPDLSKNVLVFLPTYRSLELQWSLLKGTSEPFQLFALHSSIDIEQSLHAMEAFRLGRRKIILATNVAESSVTIPRVSFVIDSCRSLEVIWNRTAKRDKPRLVWVSESQANQRKGRTGRTCDGTVYRLVPRNQFLQFERFETPAMQLLSLRKQVLMMLCASSKALNDPTVLLRRCINPPASETVKDALETLEDMGASGVDTRGKPHPTSYGQLLVSLPLSLEASELVIRGGRLGYLQECAVLATILDSTPNPIMKPFGNIDLYNVNVSNYYKSPNEKGAQGSHPVVMLANLCAYEFWQKTFKDSQRMDVLIQQARNAKLHINGHHRSDPEVSEADWCAQHKLSFTALRSVAETADTVMDALHRFRPTFLSKISGPPSYITRHTSRHACSSIFQADNRIASDQCCNSSGDNSWREVSAEKTDDGLKGHDPSVKSAGVSESRIDRSFQGKDQCQAPQFPGLMGNANNSHEACERNGTINGFATSSQALGSNGLREWLVTHNETSGAVPRLALSNDWSCEEFDNDCSSFSKASKPKCRCKATTLPTAHIEVNGNDSCDCRESIDSLPSTQTERVRSDNGLNCHAEPSVQSTDSDAWDDWTFKESEKVFDNDRYAANKATKPKGHHKEADKSSSRGEMNGSEPEPSSDKRSMDGIENNGQMTRYSASQSKGQKADTHVNGSKAYHEVGNAGSADPNSEASCGDRTGRRRYQSNCKRQVDSGEHCDDNGRVSCGDQRIQESHSSANGEAFHHSNLSDDPHTCSSFPYTQSATFHSADDEQKLLAVVVEVQHGRQAPAMSDAVGQTLGDQMSGPRPICNYFQRGICNKGENCEFSHSPSAQQMPCKFFNTPTGCRFGSSCRFFHNDPGRYVLPNTDGPVNFEESPPTAQSMLALLPNLNKNEFILLFGEGDFSFAEALSRYVRPENIRATSLDSEQTFLNDPILCRRLQSLENLPPPLWNVDVTSLIDSSGPGKRVASENLVKRIPWTGVRCVIWNFPFASIADDVTRHQILMSRFFASLSIIMMSLQLQPVPIIITLCNDQFGRWQVERAARNSFFFLRTSVPFDVNTFGGYRPMRNNLQSAFPWQRAFIYEFVLHPPLP